MVVEREKYLVIMISMIKIVKYDVKIFHSIRKIDGIEVSLLRFVLGVSKMFSREKLVEKT